MNLASLLQVSISRSSQQWGSAHLPDKHTHKHTYASAAPVMQTGHTQHSCDHRQYQWFHPILLAGWIRAEVFLDQDEGLSMGIYAHLCPMWILLAAGLRYLVSPCPTQLRHLAYKSSQLQPSCWSRSPRTQRKWCMHTHTHMQTSHWCCWPSSLSPPVSWSWNLSSPVTSCTDKWVSQVTTQPLQSPQ